MSSRRITDHLVNVESAENYADYISRLYEHELSDEARATLDKYNVSSKVVTKNITLQVTEDCNLACTYCYQKCKTKKAMTVEMAKKAVDSVLDDPDIYNRLGLIVEFIGGEPFLAIDLIDEITEYVLLRLCKINLKLASRTKFSICSNGLLYFNPKVQEYIAKYHDMLSFSVSIDGFKELHDSCRVTPTGEPSYDIAIKAAKHFMKHYGYLGSKMTFSPENIKYVAKGIINMIELGYRDIHCNCAYEPNWTWDDAKLLYDNLVEVSDYIIDNELESKVFVSMFDVGHFRPINLKDPDDCQNWCGGNGSMLAVGCDGMWYPCLRYMPSSMGGDQEPITCGDIENGLDHEVLKKLQEINLLTQSTDECINCPVAKGCSWCTAYNYQVYGTPNKRVINICPMHKAAALATAYFYNKVYNKLDSSERFPVHLPKEDAIKFTTAEQYDEIVRLANTPNSKGELLFINTANRDIEKENKYEI